MPLDLKEIHDPTKIDRQFWEDASDVWETLDRKNNQEDHKLMVRLEVLVAIGFLLVFILNIWAARG